jgi:hypothetical protein
VVTETGCCVNDILGPLRSKVVCLLIIFIS